MKKYHIIVVPKFEKNPSSEEFETICDNLVDAVDELCNHNERSFKVTFPLQSEIDKGMFSYQIHIFIKGEDDLRSTTIFEKLNPIHPLTLVNLQEKRFCKRADTEIYWFHEGETTYWDGGTYISPNYDLYIKGNTYYTVQYVPVAIKNMYERDKERYKGVTYMWRCTGSWDNFMNATTLDGALKEFEGIYHNMLWRTIEGTRKSLNEAEDNFRDFVDYQWRTK